MISDERVVTVAQEVEQSARVQGSFFSINVICMIVRSVLESAASLRAACVPPAERVRFQPRFSMCLRKLRCRTPQLRI